MIKLKVKGSKIDDLCGAPISLKTNQEKFPRKVATYVPTTIRPVVSDSMNI